MCDDPAATEAGYPASPMPKASAEPRLFTAFLTPGRAARGPWRALGLGVSFMVHLLGFAVLLVGLAALDKLDNDIIDLLQPSSLEDLLELILFVVIVESLFLLTALLTTCWGAGPEPWGDGYQRTLCRWYQLAPWHALLIVGWVGGFELIDFMEDAYYDNFIDYGSYDYLEYEFARFLIEACRVALSIFCMITLLWMTLATLAVHRDRPTWRASCRWPAVCETCGYSLLGMRDEQACPECGRAVAESRHAPRGPLKGGFWALTAATLAGPSAMGGRLLTRRPTHGHLRVFVTALLLTVLVGPISIALMHVAQWMEGYSTYGWVSTLEWIERLVLIGLAIGCGYALIGAMVCLSAGSIHALIERLFARRNVLPASCQACCLTAGVIPLLALFNAAMVVGLELMMRRLNQAGLYAFADLLPMILLLIDAGLFALYVMLVARVARAARYANV